MLRTLLSGSISIEAWRFHITRNDINHFASCTTTSLFYVRLSKNSFLVAQQVSSWKRMQRYDFFPNHQNFLKKKFSFYRKKFRDLIWVKRGADITPYYINTHARAKNCLRQQYCNEGSPAPYESMSNTESIKYCKKDTHLFGGLHIYP